MNLFPKRDEEPGGGEPEQPEARRYVPASVMARPSRLTVAAELADEADEADDADLAFLESLLADVDGGGEPDPPPAAARRQPAVAPAEPDELQPFRERAVDYDERVHERSRQIPDLSLVQLVDELETVAAALRMPKAA